MARVSMSTVVVAHDSLAELRRSLPPLLAQLSEEDELVVVDNASSDGLAAELERLAPSAKLVALDENIGFAAGANRGVGAGSGELVVLLNPDAIVQPGWADAIRAAWGGPWAAWMALVLLEGGQRINTSGGVLHFTGFGWAGQVDEPRQAAPRRPSEVAFVSGACMAIPRVRWDELGGFPEHFFMYCEDVDLSLRLRLMGEKLAVVPDAVVEHLYEFAKGGSKFRLLERNRWATVIRTYPRSLLLAVLPALIAAEAVVWVAAFRGAWWRMKVLATFDVLRALPRLLQERRRIQDRRTAPVRALTAVMSERLDSPYFGRLGRAVVLRVALRGYWHVAKALLR
jgi:N-acetylglucosaminyl-diphospho-decaprenol L-rhamnosyltransferase